MKIITFFLICLTLTIIGLSIYLSYYYEEPTMTLNGFDLKVSDYNKMKEQFKDYVGFKVCNIKSGNCVDFFNIDKTKEIIDNGNTART